MENTAITNIFFLSKNLLIYYLVPKKRIRNCWLLLHLAFFFMAKTNNLRTDAQDNNAYVQFAKILYICLCVHIVVLMRKRNRQLQDSTCYGFSKIKRGKANKKIKYANALGACSVLHLSGTACPPYVHMHLILGWVLFLDYFSRIFKIYIYFCRNTFLAMQFFLSANGGWHLFDIHIARQHIFEKSGKCCMHTGQHMLLEVSHTNVTNIHKNKFNY